MQLTVQGDAGILLNFNEKDARPNWLMQLNIKYANSGFDGEPVEKLTLVMAFSTASLSQMLNLLTRGITKGLREYAEVVYCPLTDQITKDRNGVADSGFDSFLQVWRSNFKPEDFLSIVDVDYTKNTITANLLPNDALSAIHFKESVSSSVGDYVNIQNHIMLNIMRLLKKNHALIQHPMYDIEEIGKQANLIHDFFNQLGDFPLNRELALELNRVLVASDTKKPLPAFDSLYESVPTILTNKDVNEAVGHELRSLCKFITNNFPETRIMKRLLNAIEDVLQDES